MSTRSFAVGDALGPAVVGERVHSALVRAVLVDDRTAQPNEDTEHGEDRNNAERPVSQPSQETEDDRRCHELPTATATRQGIAEQSVRLTRLRCVDLMHVQVTRPGQVTSM